MDASAAERKRRILIVDDDKNITHLIKVLLERTGIYVVFEENDALKAAQAARDFKPDVIFLDIEMPERDGGDVAVQIETDLQLQRTPIVFLTALVTKTEAKGGLRIQGRPTLAKPISIPDLINAVEQNLPKYAAFRAVPPTTLDQMGDANVDAWSRCLGL